MKKMVFKQTKHFQAADLEALFLSIQWESGYYPERLQQALSHYGFVCSAWDGERLVGLIAAMDDGVMTAYVHYLIVHPEYQGQHIGQHLVSKLKEHYQDYLKIVLCAVNDKVTFYEKNGFQVDPTETAMCLSTFPKH